MAGNQQGKSLLMYRLTFDIARIPPSLQARSHCPSRKTFVWFINFLLVSNGPFYSQVSFTLAAVVEGRSGVTQSFWKACVISLPYGDYFILLSSITLACQRCTREARCIHFCCLLVATRRPASTSKCWRWLWRYSHCQLCSHGVPLAF